MTSLSMASLGIIVPLLMATFVIMIRMRAAKKPVSARKIILPPLFMSTGFIMFHFPEAITPLPYDILAFLVGMVLSIPLILTSKFEIVGQDVYLRRSKIFFVILLGLLIIRTAIKLWIGDAFTPMQTGGLFFILAFGMILPWRVAMLFMYQRLIKKQI
ncbi:cytochrome c biogenesis protein CcdC [Brevibacillus sp. SYP-B805]|uniref:CcdC family protein n=1 Tax=Brevibacillus sp. SYP-B805 TaxID=1578199 RepID=UPI0013EA8940|nr:cytochrome c biogenesis protein CcdC [Brevibacillus sp. SYP-B805]NGQ93791.1 cytochrome c biogenesis protein CcdC [Brevibacillus sp. SYP-B805]